MIWIKEDYISTNRILVSKNWNYSEITVGVFFNNKIAIDIFFNNAMKKSYFLTIDKMRFSVLEK